MKFQVQVYMPIKGWETVAKVASKDAGEAVAASFRDQHKLKADAVRVIESERKPRGPRKNAPKAK